MNGNYNLRRKMIAQLVHIMGEQDTNLLNAGTILRDYINDATDIIRETHDKPCEALHEYIKGERCYRCAKYVFETAHIK